MYRGWRETGKYHLHRTQCLTCVDHTDCDVSKEVLTQDAVQQCWHLCWRSGKRFIATMCPDSRTILYNFREGGFVCQLRASNILILLCLAILVSWFSAWNQAGLVAVNGGSGRPLHVGLVAANGGSGSRSGGCQWWQWHTTPVAVLGRWLCLPQALPRADHQTRSL